MKNFIILMTLLFAGFVPADDMKSSYGHIKAYYVLEKMQIASGYFEEFDTILKDLNLQLEEMSYMKASSFIMLHSKGKTYLSTSEHVCKELKDFVTNKKFKILGKKLLLSLSQTKFGMFSPESLSLYTITPKIFVYDFEGNRYLFKDVVVSVPEKDMCVLRTEKVWGTPVRLAKDICLHKTIYNMSSSAGYYYPNAVPIRQGFMNGIVHNQEIGGKTFKDVNLYTLSVQPGASGSAVFNKSGEVCGTINIAYVKVDLSSGASLEDLRSLFEKTNNTL